MKKIYCFLLSLVIFSFLGFTSIGSAQTIEYKVTSGGKSVTLTNSYDLDDGSSAHSHINVGSNPSISSHTDVSGPGDVEISVEANDGTENSKTSIDIMGADSATINTTANAAHSTHTSIGASGTGASIGIMRGESKGNRDFCGFTGDFSASGNAGGGNVNVSSSYNNPLANIFYVTKNPNPNSCQTPHYDNIQAAVDDANSVGERADAILVDEGEYTGAKIAKIGGKNNLSLCGVWGVQDTTINGRTGGGSTLYVHDSPNFGIQGFTITGGTRPSGEAGKRGHGLDVTNCENIMIEDNTIQNNEGNGIAVENSNNAQITGNTIQNNKWNGIYVYGSNDAQIKDNTVQNNKKYGIYVTNSNDAQIKDNTVQNNDDGIKVYGSNNAKIKGNTVQNNNWNGIQVYESDNAQITGNNIFENTNHGLNNDSGNPVNAENNWWGPGGTGANAGKPGEDGNNDVSGNVDYDPWSTTPFQIGGVE